MLKEQVQANVLTKCQGESLQATLLDKLSMTFNSRDDVQSFCIAFVPWIFELLRVPAGQRFSLAPRPFH